MTKITRREAPDERADRANSPTSPPTSDQTCPTEIASTSPSLPLGINDSQTPPPPTTTTKDKSNLETHGIVLPSLASVNQYLPSVLNTTQAMQHDRRNTTRSTHNPLTAISNHNNIPTPHTAPPRDTPITITHLIDALNTDDQNITNLIQTLRDAWSTACNARGTQITKRQLIQ